MLKHYCLAGCMMFALAAANAQTAAQTLLKTNETPPAGTNGYAALHLFPYHTTPQQQAEWLRHPHTATDWEKLPHATDFACPNKYDTDACTAHVRTHLPAFQAALPRHRAVLDNLDRLAQSDHISVPPQHFETASLATTRFPAYATLLQTGRAAAITEWLSGKAQDALSRSCRHIKIGRMMLARPQSLVQSATGNALIRQYTELFAHILAQHPESARRLPASCAAVFAPLPEQDMGLCRAMKYEYRSLANDMTADRPQTSGIPVRLGAYWHGFKIKVLLRENAEHAAFACTDDALAQLRGDAPFQTPVPRFSLGKWLWNMEIHTEYQQYAQQLQDTRLRLNAVRALLKLYQLPAPPDDAAVQQVLAAHATPARALTWDAAQGQITFPLYQAVPKDTPHAALPFKRQNQ